MAQFDIEYSRRLPPAQGPNAIINPEVSQGAGMVARAIGGIGGALFDIDQKIQLAKDSMELSTMESQAATIWTQAYDSMNRTADTEGRIQLYQKAQQDAQAITSKRAKVNEAYQIHLNSVMPQWDYHFRTLDRNMSIQSARDQLTLNGQKWLADGSPEAKAHYRKDLETGLSTGLLSRPEYDDFVEFVDEDSLRAQAAADLAMFRYGDAEKKASELLAGGKLHGNRLKDASSILAMAKQGQKEKGEGFSKAILREMVDADAEKINPLARTNLAADIKRRLTDPNNGLSDEQSRIMLNYVDNWAKPGDVETEWPVYEKVRKLVGPVARGEMKLDDALSVYYESASDLSRQEQKELMEKLISASEQKAEEPEKDPVFARGMATISKWLTDDFLVPSDDYLKRNLPPDEWNTFSKYDDEQKTVYKKAYATKRWRDYSNDFEQWYKDSPTATAEQIEKYLDDIIKLPKTEAAKEWLGEKIWNWMGRNPPHTLLRRDPMKYAQEQGLELHRQLFGEKSKPSKKWKKGDTRLVNGVTYTYDGEAWSD